MSIRLVHDPMADALEVINDLYPDIDVMVTYYAKDPEVYNWGFAAWLDNDKGTEIPLIMLNVLAPHENIPEILIHEAAHIIAGDEHDHDEVWAQPYTAIWNELHRRYAERFGKVRKGLTVYQDKNIEASMSEARQFDREAAGDEDLTGWLVDPPMSVIPMKLYVGRLRREKK